MAYPTHIHQWAKTPAGSWSCIIPDCRVAYTGPQPVARKTDPETSWDAAESVDKVRLTRTRQEILRVLKANPFGLTDERIWDLIDKSNTSPSGARTRRRELIDAGLVEDSGRRVKGRTNRRMIVWRAT